MGITSTLLQEKSNFTKGRSTSSKGTEKKKRKKKKKKKNTKLRKATRLNGQTFRNLFSAYQ